jgi:trigger factor
MRFIVSTQETAPDVNSTIHNDNLTVAITQKPHCQIKFDIKVTPQAVEATYQKALKNVNKEVIVPGFRKGKAPEAFITKKYQSAIQKEFIDLVLQTGFNEALQLTHLHPLKDGHVKRPIVHECSREKGAQFTIEFEARPLIPSIKLEDLQLRKIPPQPITDKERKSTLHNLQLQFATYEPIEDRPVQEDDFIDVNVTFLDEPPREVVKKQRTQVNAEGLPSWLRQKVIGLRAGESAEGMTEQDPSLVEIDPDLKSLPFRVTVDAIWKGNVPSVDEELAKRVGLQSVEELHKKINERLENDVQEDSFKQNIQALENLLVEKYSFDLPQSYIDSNKQARLNHHLRQLEEKKQDYTEEDLQRYEKILEQSTIFHLQIFFLLHKIAADYQIEVTAADIGEELNRQIGLMQLGRSNIDLSSDREQLKEELHNLALEHKIKQFLLDNTSFIES